MTLCPLAESDLDRMMVIQQLSPESAPWSLAACRSCLVDETLRRHTIGLGAEDGGELIAFLVARCVADELEILNLAVVPQYRRKGLGTRLLQSALSEAEKRGAGRAFLEVRESNRAAVAFYARMGFVPAGRRTAYYSSPLEDALLLERREAEEKS